MDEELQEQIDAVRRGEIKDDHRCLRIIRDAMQANIADMKQFRAQKTAELERAEFSVQRWTDVIEATREQLQLISSKVAEFEIQLKDMNETIAEHERFQPGE